MQQKIAKLKSYQDFDQFGGKFNCKYQYNFSLLHNQNKGYALYSHRTMELKNKLKLTNEKFLFFISS